MTIVWNEKSARWFADASEYTGYHKKLAALLLELLPGSGELTDIGCGTGLIDMELAAQYRRVTCVDISPEALRYLGEMAKSRGITNIVSRLCDGAAVEDRFDDVIAIFHGDPELFAYKYIPMAKAGFAAVVHSEPNGKLGPESYRVQKCNTAQETAKLFDKLDIKYLKRDVQLEYGQPFRNIEDARDFTRAYSSNPPDEAVDDYLETHLEKTGERDFPLYLPNKKTFCIFTVKKE